MAVLGEPSLGGFSQASNQTSHSFLQPGAGLRARTPAQVERGLLVGALWGLAGLRWPCLASGDVGCGVRAAAILCALGAPREPAGAGARSGHIQSHRVPQHCVVLASEAAAPCQASVSSPRSCTRAGVEPHFCRIAARARAGRASARGVRSFGWAPVRCIACGCMRAPSSWPMTHPAPFICPRPRPPSCGVQRGMAASSSS